MSLASVAAQQNSRPPRPTQPPQQPADPAHGGRQTGTTALTSLSGNFSDFLKLLMTQLQNQDPTSPMDTNAVHHASWCSSPASNSRSTPTRV